MALPPYHEDHAAPASQAGVIDPSGGDVALTQPTRGLYVGGSGDVKVDMAGATGASDGIGITFPTMAGGVIHALEVIKVYQAGTTATGLRAVY